MTSRRIGAVVVAWNSGDSLGRCVNALRESARLADEQLRIVVVDNGSTDGAVVALTPTLGPDDIVVRNPLNAGYGVAAAQGLTLAEAAWVLLVNPDVVVDRGFFDALRNVADHVDPEVATLVPEMRFAARPDVVNCRGVTVDEIGVPAEIDAGIAVTRDAGLAASPLGGSSGCCLLRSSAVDELGGPEPGFFAYLEDVDLALRLARAGNRAVFVPDAIALHQGSASTGTQSPLKVFLVARSRRMLFRLNGPYTLRARTRRTIVDVAHAVYSSFGTPLAPWSGRLRALGTHRYTDFLLRSRAAHDVRVTAPALSRRASLGDALRRKRRVLSSAEHEARARTDPRPHE